MYFCKPYISEFKYMNRTNYALITALYDTKGADLYNDVYFPIIKYEIVNQYYTQVDIEKYYDLEELQGIIKVDFGISIPLVVLKQSIKAIGKNSNGILLSVYENGKQFKIQKAWDISINLSIDDKSRKIEIKFKELELAYKEFLEIEGLSCENSFIDFYSDNTEEIFSYLENNNGDAIIDERYANLAKFLFWIKENNTELYNIANDIFWGSIIAGFLKRNTADINIKSNDKVEYFLDSALVLAALDLDNLDNVRYANELLEIIKSSGNIAKVHAMTIREVKYILNSVEKEQGPRPNTAIEEAYYRRNLTPSKILQIKNNLPKLISDKGIVIFPASEIALDDIEVEYKHKQSVKELETFRGGNNNNGIRDIHDVYLRDYIQKKRKDIVSIEKVNAYFVSLNSDLISYFNKMHQDKLSLLIHPAKIIIDLWIHSSHSSFVKKNGLTEIMSRCFALNNTDIRRKLRLVAKYYKESDTNYSRENYQAIYKALIGRSTKAMHEINLVINNEEKNIENKEETNKKHIEALIKIAVEEEISKQQRNSDLSKEIANLSKDRKIAEAEIISAKKVNKIKDRDIQLLQEQQSKNQETITELREELKKQKRLSEINERISIIGSELTNLEKNKNNSICLIKYYLIIGLELLCLLVGIICLFIAICSYINKDESINFQTYISDNWIIWGITVIFSALGFITKTIHPLYILNPRIKYEAIKKEQINYWIETHPDYNTLKNEFEKLKREKYTLSNPQ